MSAPERFAAHVLGLRLDDAPAEARAAAKAFYLDTLAVGVAGRKAWLADAVLGVARGWGEAGDGPTAHVFGLGEDGRLPAASAAFVNGFQIHCQEYDCVHEPAVVHPMATIAAALSAEAEARPVPGSDFLAALIGAVDVAAGLGVAVKSPIRFFRPANAGVFGATLGVARMRGLSQGQALDALGYALAQAAGTMQAHVEGKPALPVQIAGAARAAITACDLAEAGLPGPHDVLEGPFGYLTLFEEDWDLEPVLASLGGTFRITEVSYKPWPTGRAAQGGLGLVERLAADELKPGEVEHVRLIAPPLIKRLVGRPASETMQINYARLCFPYLAATALRRGTVGLGDFTAEALRDADTLALSKRIDVIDDGTVDPAAFCPETIEARLSDGTTRTAELDALYGSPDDPMTDDDVAAKRAACLAFGLGEPAPERDAALSETVNQLENLEDAGAAARLAAGV